jgi:DNA-binding CsgD family transcriptional regulator
MTERQMKTLELRDRIGALLENGGLSLREIARRAGVSGQAVSYYQQKWFPTTPKRSRGPGKLVPTEQISALLRNGGTTAEIARTSGVSPATVRTIRSANTGDYWNLVLFAKELKGVLRESGAKYCASCKRAVDLCEFSASALVAGTTNGYCRPCLKARKRDYYAASAHYREYLANNRKEQQQRKTAQKNLMNLEIYAPALAKQVRAGSLTITAALDQLSIPPPAKRGTARVELSVLGFLSAITECLTPEEIAELKERL